MATKVLRPQLRACTATVEATKGPVRPPVLVFAREGDPTELPVLA